MLEDDNTSHSSEWQNYFETTPSLPFVNSPSHSPDNPSPEQSTSQPEPQPVTRTEIEQLLVTHRLGKVQKEYKNEVSTTLAAGLSSCMLGVICLLPLILSTFAQMGYFAGMRGLFIFSFGFLGYGINRVTIAVNNIGSNMLYQNPRSYLCFHGVMSIKGKQVQAIRWDAIKAIQKICHTGVSDIPQQYILYPLSEEEPVVLDNMFTGFRIFGKQIEREMTQQLLSKSIAAFRAGHTLNFGAFNVTSKGLSVGGNPETLSWERLGAIDEIRGYLVIKERGNLSPWRIMEVSTLFNLCILPPLIQQIKIDNRIKGEGQRIVPANDSLPQSEWGEYE